MLLRFSAAHVLFLPSYSLYSLPFKCIHCLQRGVFFAEANQLQVEASFHCTCSCFLIKSESGKSLWSLKSCRQLPSFVELSCQATIRPQSTLLFTLSLYSLSPLHTSLFTRFPVPFGSLKRQTISVAEVIVVVVVVEQLRTNYLVKPGP